MTEEIKNVQLRLSKDAREILESFVKRSGTTKTMLVEDLIFYLNGLKKDPEKLEKSVGPLIYEKYFK